VIQEGQVVLFRFPQTDQGSGKLRPALVLRQLPSPHNDWLICMISSQLRQAIPDFDELVTEEDSDFERSGLKNASVIGASRLAVVEKSLLLGAIGKIDDERLQRMRNKLADWLKGTRP